MLPDWIYKQLFAPYGWHLPKREEFREIYSYGGYRRGRAYHSDYGYSPTFGTEWGAGDTVQHLRDIRDSKVDRTLSRMGFHAEHIPGGGIIFRPKTALDTNYRPVSGGDYRYWFGSKSTYSMFAMCRCCREQYWTTGTRKGHLHDRVANCNKYITHAIKLLRLDHKCAICDVKTGKQKWGVPLCSVECMKKWMYDGYEAKSVEALALALERAGANITEYARLMGYEG
jgi:hypothetical protein